MTKHEVKVDSAITHAIGRYFDINIILTITRKGANLYINYSKSMLPADVNEHLSQPLLIGPEEEVKKTIGKILLKRLPAKEEWYAEFADFLAEKGILHYVKTTGEMTMVLVQNAQLKTYLKQITKTVAGKFFQRETTPDKKQNTEVIQEILDKIGSYVEQNLYMQFIEYLKTRS